MKRGRMFAFEGGDGMGKATQSKLLADKLGAKLFSFPRYETEVGQAIRGSCRGILEMREYRDIAGAFAENKKINALTRQALFLLDRCDAAPAIDGYLTSGVDVVCDRYWPSGVVYGADDGLDEQLLIRAHSILPQPDVWILLDGPVEESFRRRPERQDNYERDVGGARRRRQAYRELFVVRRNHVHKVACRGGLAYDDPLVDGSDCHCTCDVRHWYTVDAVGSVEEVHGRVLDRCRRVFGRDFLTDVR